MSDGLVMGAGMVLADDRNGRVGLEIGPYHLYGDNDLAASPNNRGIP